MRHGSLVDDGINQAEAHAYPILVRGIFADDGGAAGFAEVFGLSRGRLIAREIGHPGDYFEVARHDNAIGGEGTTLGLATERAMTIHDIAYWTVDFESDSSTKTATCVHIILP